MAINHRKISAASGLSCVSACGVCRETECYNETVEREETVSSDDFENYDNLMEKLF